MNLHSLYKNDHLNGCMLCLQTFFQWRWKRWANQKVNVIYGRLEIQQLVLIKNSRRNENRRKFADELIFFPSVLLEYAITLLRMYMRFHMKSHKLQSQALIKTTLFWWKKEWMRKTSLACSIIGCHMNISRVQQRIMRNKVFIFAAEFVASATYANANRQKVVNLII